MADRGFTIGLMVFVLGFIGLGQFHYEYAWPVIRFPMMVGMVTCLLCLGSLLRGIAVVSNEPDADSELPSESATVGQTVSAMIWVAAVMPTIFLLGYVIGLPLYIFVYSKTHDLGWVASGLLSILTFAVVYLGFVKLLSVPLPILPIGFS